MVDGDGSSMKAWDFFMALVQIYSMFICPFILVFPQVYQNYNEDDQTWETVTSQQGLLKMLEILVDICFIINITLNFIKRTRQNKNFKNIWISYLTSSFVFDIIGTLPCFFNGENLRLYWLKIFRCIVHMFWLT